MKHSLEKLYYKIVGVSFSCTAARTFRIFCIYLTYRSHDFQTIQLLVVVVVREPSVNGGQIDYKIVI